MPPRNVGRSLYSEESVARRVAQERERRGWSYEGLAQRMTDAGCPINQSAIYKIERGTKSRTGEPGPPRRITVDELVAFSTVFDVPIGDLLLPPDLVAQEEARGLIDAWARSWAAADRARQDAQDALDALLVHLAANSDRGLNEAVLTHFRKIFDWRDDADDDPDGDGAERLLKSLRRLAQLSSVGSFMMMQGGGSGIGVAPHVVVTRDEDDARG